MNEITRNTIVSRCDDIIVGKVDEDVMMASIETGKYYQLNPTGSQLWDLLEQPKSVDQLCQLLARDFKVAPDACLRDVIHFLKEMTSRNVLAVRNEHSTSCHERKYNGKRV